jgi:hypothetical protein
MVSKRGLGRPPGEDRRAAHPRPGSRGAVVPAVRRRGARSCGRQRAARRGDLRRRLGVYAPHSRFPTKHHFAAHTGTAPLEASSGQVIPHRLSRAGDRKLNHALYMTAIVQVRRPSAGQAYYRRKLAEGKSPKEALRCLIGGLSRSRLEVGPWLLGERRGTAPLPRRVTARFSTAAPDARRGPVTGVRDMPDRGPNNETPAAGLDTVESTPAPRRRPG